MKKRLWLLWVLGALFLFAIAGVIAFEKLRWKEVDIELDANYHELFSDEYMEKKGHITELAEYVTDVSIGYQNADGTKTLYVYASPIRFLNSSGQYSLIDTRLANVRDKKMREAGYIYTIANSDIKSFYPKEFDKDTGVLIQNDIQYEVGISDKKDKLGWCKDISNFVSESKKAVEYYNCFDTETTISFYPSSLGSNCEIKIFEELENKRLSFWMKTDETLTLNKEPGGYLTLNKVVTDAEGKTSNEIKGVIQKPLLRTEDGIVSYNCSIEVQPQGSGYYELIFCLDDNVNLKNSSLFIAFEMRREKQPDNALYSKIPNLEYAYLRNYSVIGNSNDYGIGRLMIRYKFAKFMNLEASQIKEAKYSVLSLDTKEKHLSLLSVLEDWCSLTGNWNDHYRIGEITSTTKIQDNEIVFDITNEVKKWCEDPTGQMEHNGVLLKAVEEKEGVYYVILSNDNSLYRNVTEVILN